MDFSLTPDQRLIRETARAYLAGQASRGRLRAALDGEAGYDAALWHGLGREMGWLGMAIPEEYGGAGLGIVDLALLMEEMGRTLSMTPFFPTAGMAVPLILAAASEAQKAELLPPIAAGETRAAVCLTGPAGRPVPHGVSVELSADGRLSGEAWFVPFAEVADLLVVVARAAAGLCLAVAPSTAQGIAVTRCPSLDLTRPHSRVRFAGAACDVLGDPALGAETLRRGLDVAAVLLAAEQLGGAEQSLESSVEYAKQRVQFGRPIGAFQAIKHKLADMMLLVEGARSAAYYAACVADEAPADLPEAASVARAYASDAYFRCAAEAIQVHGGIGFTWEHDAHLHFRRAKAAANLLGDVAHHRERLAVLMGLGDAA